MFKITDHVDFDSNGRAICPSCEIDGKGKKKNLALIPGTDGAYKCHRGCQPEDIRSALGAPKDKQVPANLVKSTKSVTVNPAKVKEGTDQLTESDGPAKEWLIKRGITNEMIQHYRLGVVKVRQDNRQIPAISIPIPANQEGTEFFLKKRIAPWIDGSIRPSTWPDWSQYGIPARVFFTHRPEKAVATWICEGEWDAMMMGWQLRGQEEIAVACFTCGAGNVPGIDQLDLLVGNITIWYDLDEPGQQGAKKLAKKLGDRGRLATVPHPENPKNGWDVSDALATGLSVDDFMTAARAAVIYQEEKPSNPLKERIIWNDELLATAPDFQEWLVPDLLTANELFILAAGPRVGKSLLSMGLAHAVATGGKFLDRPCTKGKVLYVSLEDGRAKIKEREMAQGWGEGVPVAWLEKFKISELDHLRDIALEMDPRLIILDTLSRVRDDDSEETSAKMSRVLEPIQELAKEVNCCILIVHHTIKEVTVKLNDLSEVFDTIRGSGSIRGVCRGSMVIAKSDGGHYRIAYENGWGKGDLSVVLDANTWSWKLLGNWQPSQEGSSHKQLIIDTLQRLGSATVDQIFDATQIPKKSLYKALERLQVSEVASEKVIKEGSRRSFTYRLPLFDTIRQLDTLSNSANANLEKDTAYIRQKNFPNRSDDSICSLHSEEAIDDDVNANAPPPTRSSGEVVEYSPEDNTGKGYAYSTRYSTTIRQGQNSANSTSLQSKGEFRRWTKIDTAVHFYEIRGDRAKIRVPGARRIQWVPASELEPINGGESDALE